MNNIRNCPFCGGKAEVYSGRNFSEPWRGTYETKEQVQEKLEKHRAMGTVTDYHISNRYLKRANMKNPILKWHINIEMQAFIPRCCDPYCVGRTQKMFLTEKEAIEAWNARYDSSED